MTNINFVYFYFCVQSYVWLNFLSFIIHLNMLYLRFIFSLLLSVIIIIYKLPYKSKWLGLLNDLGIWLATVRVVTVRTRSWRMCHVTLYYIVRVNFPPSCHPLHVISFVSKFYSDDSNSKRRRWLHFSCGKGYKDIRDARC